VNFEHNAAETGLSFFPTQFLLWYCIISFGYRLIPNLNVLLKKSDTRTSTLGSRQQMLV